MHAIYELKDMLCKELEEYGEKGELTAGSLEVVDKLANTIKNLDKIIECYEDEGYSSRGGSYEGMYEDGMGGSYARGGRGGGNRGGGGRRGGANQYGSYDMRGSYRRDSRGRYSRDGGMVEDLRELMQSAPDERTRQEFQKFITKIENM